MSSIVTSESLVSQPQVEVLFFAGLVGSFDVLDEFRVRLARLALNWFLRLGFGLVGHSVYPPIKLMAPNTALPERLARATLSLEAFVDRRSLVRVIITSIVSRSVSWVNPNSLAA